MYMKFEPALLGLQLIISVTKRTQKSDCFNPFPMGYMQRALSVYDLKFNHDDISLYKSRY